MNRETKHIVGAALVAAIGASSGCQQVAQMAKGRVPGQSGGTGNWPAVQSTAAVAQLSPAVLGKYRAKNSEKWALGIAAGAYVADAVITQEVAKRRASYKKESEYLDAEIATTQQSVDAKKTELQAIQAEVQRQSKAVVSLEQASQQNRLSRTEAQRTRDDLDKLVVRTQEEVKVAEVEVSIATEDVNTSKAQTSPSDSPAELEQRRNTLLAKRDERLDQYKMLLSSEKEAQDLHDRVASLR